MRIWVNDEFKAVRIEGTAAQVKAWNGIVAALDTSANNEKIVVRENLPSGKLREAVAVLDGATPARTVQTQVPQGEQQQAANDPQAPPGADQNSPLGPVRVDVVEGTDSLMLRGSPEDVERVLVELANGPDIESSNQLSDVRRRIDEQDLIFRLRVMTAEMRARERDAQPTW